MNMFLNLIIILLLVAALIYAMVLNHRLSSLKESKREILQAVQSFHEVARSAEVMLSQIRQSSQTITEQLKTEMNKASLLRDDLVLLMEKTTSSSLPSIFNESHNKPKPVSYIRPRKSNTEHNFGENLDIYQSEAERELFEALQRLKGS